MPQYCCEQYESLLEDENKNLLTVEKNKKKYCKMKKNVCL